MTTEEGGMVDEAIEIEAVKKSQGKYDEEEKEKLEGQKGRIGHKNSKRIERVGKARSDYRRGKKDSWNNGKREETETMEEEREKCLRRGGRRWKGEKRGGIIEGTALGIE